MSATMTNKEFERLAQAYGGDLSRWPEKTRRAASAFQQQNPLIAKDVLGHQIDVDQALSQLPHQDISVDLETQILRSFPSAKVKRTTRGLWALTNLVRPTERAMPAWGMALALLLVSGFIGGYTGYTYALDQPDSTDIIADAFGTVDASFFAEDSTT